MALKKIKNESEIDYRLIGIASTQKEYRLCHHLNRALELDFEKQKDNPFESVHQTHTVKFSVYMSANVEGKNQFILFSNKNRGEFLLPEISNFDFVLQVKGKCSDEEIANIIEAVKQLPEVMFCVEIPVKKIRNSERLIYEAEKEPRKIFLKRRNK